MNYHRIFLLMLYSLIAQTCFSQQGSVTVGGDATGPGGTSSYSIGQMDYLDTHSPSGSSYEGLQQPYEIYQLVGTAEVMPDFEVSVFPNPAQEMVVLEIGITNFEELSYTLSDMHGRQLLKARLTDHKTAISLAEVAQATYILTVQKGEAQVKSFKIIKNQ